MDPGRWEEIQATFDELVELDPTTRASRLATLGSTDPALRQAVEILLAADAEADRRLASLEAAFLFPPSPAPDPLGLAGRTVSHFRVLEPLGAGGMGVVYRAEDTRLGRAVALKFLLPQSSLDVAAKARFLHEARSAAALDHPNLCTIYEAGESEDGRLFLAMALYPGETLKARLAREGPLPVGDALEIARQVAQGLACTHAAGIVHRDLKPGNLMMLPDGTAKILDFGLAKARDQSLSASSARLGTASYMAPEQVRGGAVDGRTDLWALGVVLYEMLTGRKPFAGEHEVAIAHAILHEEPVLPSTLRADVPAAAEDLVLTLLQKDPAKRYPAADQFLAYLVDGGALAEPAVRSAWTRWLRIRRILLGKRRWTVAVGATAAVGIVGVLVGAALLRGRNGRGHARQPEIVQLTFSGNARTPALSADGQRLAYSARQCGADGRCTVDVIVQDMEAAGRATVARGLANVADIQWTADGRYLLINAILPGSPIWGPFSVPSLGGAELHYLGCCEGHIAGATDTVLVGERPGSDSGVWLRWVTIADGVAHDSLLVPKPRGVLAVMVVPMGGGERILTKSITDSEFIAAVIDRRGQLIDSLRLNGRSISVMQPFPDGRGLLVGRVPEAYADPEDGSAVPLDLVGYPLSVDGHFKSRPDTITKGLITYQAGLMIHSIARNGTLTYASGATRYELWELPQGGSAGLISGRRRLTAATGYLRGKISPDGRRVGILRSVAIRDRQLKQFSVMSSDSGPETLVGSPQEVDDWEWSRDGSRVLLAVRGRDSLALTAVDVPGGATRVIAKLVESETGHFASLPAGGLAVVSSNTHIRRIAVPGLTDSILDAPRDYIGIGAVGSSPDGRSVVIVGHDRTMDSTLIDRVSLMDGHADRLAAFVGADPLGDPPAWLSDGSLIFAAKPGPMVEWYRVPASGGPPVRLGTSPWGTAVNSMSADGRRILATVHFDMADIYAIRNFGQLLNR